MKRSRIIILPVLIAVAAGVVLFWPRGPKEPVYQGKKLSQWLEGTLPARSTDEFHAAEKAVQAIGTNALPWLMFEFTRRDPKWIAATRSWLADQRWTGERISTERDRMWLAANGLYLLGPAIAPVLPELSEYLGDEQRGDAVAQVLSAAKEDALPYVWTATTSTNIGIAVDALSCLGLAASQTEAAIPLLIQILRTTNHPQRQLAAHWLRYARLGQDLAVPALIEALADGDPSVRWTAASSLGGLAPDSKAAVPNLRRLVGDPNSRVREFASNALFCIDPTALPPRKP